MDRLPMITCDTTAAADLMLKTCISFPAPARRDPARSFFGETFSGLRKSSHRHAQLPIVQHRRADFDRNSQPVAPNRTMRSLRTEHHAQEMIEAAKMVQVRVGN
jgi:hypothetical protein